MRFEGRFADVILPEQLDRLSVSFLTTDMQRRRGGTGANIAFGMGCLGTKPRLVASAGEDFRTVGYEQWLLDHGVDVRVSISATQHTARFISTTDTANCQINSFYAGAMSESRDIALDLAGVDLVVISPDDTEAMVRHTHEARAAGVPFVADTSQQLAFLSDRDMIRDLVDGAVCLLLNDYEQTLLQQKAEWSADEVLARVGVRVTTLGADGAIAETSDGMSLKVPAPPERRKADPTGAGDALRAGFLSAWSWGLDLERCLQVGQVLAVLALETVGTQEYDAAEVPARLAEAYGAGAAADVTPHLAPAAP
jgi:adenosine kinase